MGSNRNSHLMLVEMENGRDTLENTLEIYIKLNIVLPPVPEFWLLHIILRCIYLKASATERERHIQRERDLPKWSQEPDLDWSEASIRNSIRISQMGGKGSSTWAILICLSRCIIRNLDQKEYNQNSTPVGDANVASSSLTCCGTMLAFRFLHINQD